MTSLGPRELTDVRIAVLSTLGASPGGRLGATMERYALDIGQYEASVRPAPTRGVGGGRMMIEQAPLEVADAAADALGFALPDIARELAGLAYCHTLPLIVGWDLRDGVGEPCVKVYLNASGASEATRRALREELGIAAGAASLDAPAVIGINAPRTGGVELKLYVQHRDAAVLAGSLGPAARTLADMATSEGAAASGVASWDVEPGGARPRAFFVSLRDRADGRIWRCIEALPGWDEAAAWRAVPFAPGPVRSVGVAIDSAERWTIYVKPAAGDRPRHSLEPTATFRAGSAELGIFIEPRSAATRAYARTEHYAISTRWREGRSDGDTLESLLDWVTHQVRAAERDGNPPEPLLVGPPSPWRRVLHE